MGNCVLEFRVRIQLLLLTWIMIHMCCWPLAASASLENVFRTGFGKTGMIICARNDIKICRLKDWRNWSAGIFLLFYLGSSGVAVTASHCNECVVQTLGFGLWDLSYFLGEREKQCGHSSSRLLFPLLMHYWCNRIAYFLLLLFVLL